MNNFFSIYKNTFFSIEEKIERLRFLLALFFVISLSLDLFYSSIIFLTLTAVTLLDVSKEKFKRIPKQVWLFQLVFFLGVLGYVYSLNKHAAGFLLERQLTIFILPLLLPLAFKIDKLKTEALMSALVLSCFLVICYLFATMIYIIKIEFKLPFMSNALSGNFFNHQFSKPLNIHAGYLSLYVSFSIIYLVTLINKSESFLSKTGFIFLLLVLSTGLIFLASRNAIIATIIILIFVFPLFNITNKLRYIGISLVFLIICFFSIKNIPYLKERFSIELIGDIKPLNNGIYVNYSNTEPRIERWKAAIDLIKRSPLIGYGTGDEVDILKTEYAKRGLFISYTENFNAHNQYLSYLIKGGILQLVLFLFGFYYYLRLAIKNKDFIYFSFLFLFVIGFYTENILDANKGIVFFSFFNTFLGYRLLNEEKEKRL